MIYRYTFHAPNAFGLIRTTCECLVTPHIARQLADEAHELGLYQEAAIYDRMTRADKPQWDLVWSETDYCPIIPAAVRAQIVRRGKWPCKIDPVAHTWTYYTCEIHESLENRGWL